MLRQVFYRFIHLLVSHIKLSTFSVGGGRRNDVQRIPLMVPNCCSSVPVRDRSNEICNNNLDSLLVQNKDAFDQRCHRLGTESHVPLHSAQFLHLTFSINLPPGYTLVPFGPSSTVPRNLYFLLGRTSHHRTRRYRGMCVLETRPRYSEISIFPTLHIS